MKERRKRKKRKEGDGERRREQNHRFADGPTVCPSARSAS